MRVRACESTKTSCWCDTSSTMSQVHSVGSRTELLLR